MQLPTLQSAKLIRRYKRFLTDIELPNGENDHHSLCKHRCNDWLW